MYCCGRSITGTWLNYDFQTQKNRDLQSSKAIYVPLVSKCFSTLSGVT